MQSILEMLKSKKFKIAIAAVLAAVAAALSGAQTWGVAVTQIVGAFLVYVGAQGVADAGKEKEKLLNQEREKRCYAENASLEEGIRRMRSAYDEASLSN